MGLLTINTSVGSPLVVSREHATSGTGAAVDLGVGFVLARWEAGFGARGIGNRGGFEQRIGAIDLRGGAAYARELWQPSAGIGLNMGRRAALDLAVYGTSANVERERHAALAVSLRFNR